MGPAVTPIRLVIVEDYPHGRDALVHVLGRDRELRVLGAAGSLAEAATLASRLRARTTGPDVVVTDLRLPDAPAAGPVGALTGDDGLWPQARALVLTNSDRPHDLSAARDAGAAGYLLKSDEVDLADAIRRVARGQSVWSPVLAAFRRHGHEALTSRQREVLDLLAEGYANAEIAELLHLTTKTVENHLLHIREHAPIDGSPGSSIRVKLVNWYLGRDGRRAPGGDPAT